MKTRFPFIASILALALLLTACGPAAPAAEAPALYVRDVEEPAPAEAPIAPPAQEDSPANNAGTESEDVIYNTGAPVDAAMYERMVIKNGEIKLLVKNSDAAIDGLTQLAGDVRGYIVSSQVWNKEYGGENYKYATITISVPSDQFETALRRLRNMAIRVLNESASGQDVTDQYVDLQSQLNNLEATRDRIKSFLDQAKSVDEALKINEQLSEIEAQIEQVKGKMNYISGRSAYSTITIQIEPELPPFTPTPIPTATATATPTATPTPIKWNPGKTFEKSSKTLNTAYRGIGDFLIWFFVVFVPIMGPPALLVWLVWWIIKRAIRNKPKG